MDSILKMREKHILVYSTHTKCNYFERNYFKMPIPKESLGKILRGILKIESAC